MYQRQRKRQKGLSQLYRNKNTDRNLSVDDGFGVKNTGAEDVPVLHVTKSQQKERPYEDRDKGKRNKWKLNDTDPQQPEKLYQDYDEIRDECLYTKYTKITSYSPTNSRESRNNYAWKELMILRQKGRKPTIEVRVNFFAQFPRKKDIDDFREKIRRCLKYRKIDALIAIGLTLGKDGKPNNTVHFHYLMGDQEKEDNLRSEEEKQRRKQIWERIEILRSEKNNQHDTEIRKLIDSLESGEDRQRRKQIVGFIKNVCKRQGFVWQKDYKIESRPLWDGQKYLAYFVKYGKYGKDIPLFLEGLNMQELTQTGWFENKEKERLFDEFLRGKYGDKYSRGAKKGQKPKPKKARKGRKMT